MYKSSSLVRKEKDFFLLMKALVSNNAYEKMERDASAAAVFLRPIQADDRRDIPEDKSPLWQCIFLVKIAQAS